MIVYDLETFSTVNCIPYGNCMYKLNRISGKYNRDITERQFENCSNVCVVSKRTDCINEMLDHVFNGP